MKCGCNDIQKLLDAACDPASKNRLTVENVKRWLAEYTEMRAEEVTRFPSESGTNHWDLVAADYDSSTDAQFLVAYFAGDSITFMAGSGPISQVRAFAKNEFPSNPDDVLDNLVGKFRTGERWNSSADDVIAWAHS